MDYLEFIETAAFSEYRKKLMTDDDLQGLQAYLIEQPEKGDTISGTGGCRKIRWGREGEGKQGGVRVIYYLRTKQGKVYLVMVYPKNVKEDLTEKEKAVMKALTAKLK